MDRERNGRDEDEKSRYLIRCKRVGRSQDEVRTEQDEHGQLARRMGEFDTVISFIDQDWDSNIKK
jgi:hypothetical protein